MSEKNMWQKFNEERQAKRFLLADKLIEKGRKQGAIEELERMMRKANPINGAIYLSDIRKRLDELKEVK
jgi:hypothetical protein